MDDESANVGWAASGNFGDNRFGCSRLLQGPGDRSRLPGLDQRDHVPTAPPAGHLRSQGAGLPGRFHQPVEFRGGNAHASKQGVILVHQRAEAFGHTALDQLAGRFGDASYRCEKGPVAFRLLVMLHTHIPDGLLCRGGDACVTDHDRKWLPDV